MDVFENKSFTEDVPDLVVLSLKCGARYNVSRLIRWALPRRSWRDALYKANYKSQLSKLNGRQKSGLCPCRATRRPFACASYWMLVRKDI